MQICQQRIVQRLALILEARSRNSTIHNFDGLLRWSFLTPDLAWIWRAVIILLLALPLALSASYKQFLDGATTVAFDFPIDVFRPGALAGISSAGSLVSFANKTNALLVASFDETLVPTEYPIAYGSTILLLNDGVAASVDEPANVVELQRSLPTDSALILEADVRGTVTKYNDTIRNISDPQTWRRVTDDAEYVYQDSVLMDNTECFFDIAMQSGEPGDVINGSFQTYGSDQSWAVLGGYPRFIDGLSSNTTTFKNYSQMYNTLRYDCHARWHLTSSSFDLVDGFCGGPPLGDDFQYTKNAALGIARSHLPALAEALVPFSVCGTNSKSAWKNVATAAMLAAAYSVKLGGARPAPVNNGTSYTPVRYYNLTETYSTDGDFHQKNRTVYVYDQSYRSENVQMHLKVPTLRASLGLYMIIMVQPSITILVFAAVVLFYNTPISSGFGLVSILAGVDRDSLDVLKGASFSGELSRRVGMAIHTVVGEHESSIQYTVGEKRFLGQVQNGVTYS